MPVKPCCEGLRPFPPEVAMRIARQAVPKNRVHKEKLMCGLLAHFMGKTMKSVKRHIERAETDFPDFARRR